MAWPLNTDPEEKLKTALRDFLKAGGIETAIDGERIHPRHQIVVKSVEETRPGIPHNCENGRALWQAWTVTLDIVGDDKSAGRRTAKQSPRTASASGQLNRLFLQSNYPSRNAVGIFNAVLKNERDLRDGVEFKNPFSLSCETFTYLEE